MASKKNKTTVFSSNYVYCVYGGAMKVGLCFVATGAAHAEISLEELKKYYGNEVKGYYCKSTESLTVLTEKLTESLTDKPKLSDNLYEVKVTDIKKMIKTVANSKTGSTMGPVKVKKSDEDEDDDSEKSDKSEDEDESDEDTKKKDTKKKPAKKETKKESKKAEPEKAIKTKEVKEPKETKESKKKETKKVVKEEPKSNKTVIELSDDSDEEDEDD